MRRQSPPTKNDDAAAARRLRLSPAPIELFDPCREGLGRFRDHVLRQFLIPPFDEGAPLGFPFDLLPCLDQGSLRGGELCSGRLSLSSALGCSSGRSWNLGRWPTASNTSERPIGRYSSRPDCAEFVIRI